MAIDTRTLILEYICPGIGVVLATLMFLAPYKDVQKAIKAGSLGELNALPWVFMLGNCTGWILYSFLRQDYFLFAGNITGLIVSVWYNLSASNLLFKQQVAQLPDIINVVDLEERSGDTGQRTSSKESMDADKQQRMSAIDENKEMSNHGKAANYEFNHELPNNLNESQSSISKDEHSSKGMMRGMPPITELPVFYKPPVHDYRVMAMTLLWITVFSVIGFGEDISPNGKELTVGTVTNLCLVFFYGAPLSSIAIVLKTRNTATLHVPTMFTNTASSVFWGVYGLAVMDFFVLVPNLVGAALGFIQIALYLTYPRVETITVPVITAAIPAAGGTVGEGATEMEVVQLQLHDVSTPDLLHNTGINELSNNPLAVEYAIPTDENGNVDPNVTTLHKRKISMEGISGVHVPNTENPLVLQYSSPTIPLAPATDAESSFQPPASPTPLLSVPDIDRPPVGIGLLHRRTSSRNAGILGEAFLGTPNHQVSNNSGAIFPATATVASVHHRRILSNSGDNTFSLAGIFAGDTENVSTTTVTLHRRVHSSSIGNEHED
ncbi:sugar efflux transporter [Nitzschia inconspicua]|uniref:Sugar transporter SWEET1 n=1 Tax=Nitzschia inconspicua TaxID=303405 RepID=A0A9K3PI67_9STRA|nr:sugar efflux transporter [Nitzschia inconspicua]